MNKLPEFLYTTQDRIKCKHIKWNEVKTGDQVYLYVTNDGKESLIGPFNVYNAEKRQLLERFKLGWFYHYPEELYVPIND